MKKKKKNKQPSGTCRQAQLYIVDVCFKEKKKKKRQFCFLNWSTPADNEQLRISSCVQNKKLTAGHNIYK